MCCVLTFDFQKIKYKNSSSKVKGTSFLTFQLLTSIMNNDIVSITQSDVTYITRMTNDLTLDVTYGPHSIRNMSGLANTPGLGFANS